MITEKNESITLTKPISCECICKFDRRKCYSNEKWNNDKGQCECKKYNICEKDYISNSATCSCKNGKYLANIMDDSCNEIIEPYDEETKTIATNFNEKSNL